MARPCAVVMAALLAGGACAPRREAPAGPRPAMASPGPGPEADRPAPEADRPAPERPPEQPIADAGEQPVVAEAGPPWPDGVPRLAGATVIETARISANVGASPAGATYVTAAGEVHAVALAWIAAARAAGFRVLAERADDHVHVASLIDARGKRAHLLVQTDDEGRSAGMFNYGKHAQVRLRGRCVEVALRERRFAVDRGAIGHGGEYRRGIYEQVASSQIGNDFDGDGELDAIVPTNGRAACPEDVTWTVYLARGACMHAVGTVGPGELATWDLVSDRPGPRPIVMEHDRTELGDGGVISTKVRTTYTFDAASSRYVRQKREESRGVCHHCPWGACKALP
ncbi:MAG: hypothetical protein JNL82_05940 [Myxococcales bacterium]|nr:hypothetical protein [Myxococcales bacterium]